MYHIIFYIFERKNYIKPKLNNAACICVVLKNEGWGYKNLFIRGPSSDVAFLQSKMDSKLGTSLASFL